MMPKTIQTKTKGTASIRQSQAGDTNAIIQAINAVTAEDKWFMSGGFIPTPPWERALHEPEDYPNYLLLVAEALGEVIGWCRVFPYEFGETSRHVADFGLGLLPDWRDQGIGTALITEAIAWATDQGFEKLTLSVFSTNSRALRVFERAGFACVGTRHKQFKMDDEYADEVLMEKFMKG